MRLTYLFADRGASEEHGSGSSWSSEEHSGDEHREHSHHQYQQPQPPNQPKQPIY